MSGESLPLVIEFVPGTTLYREPELAPGLPILRNGPPGTFVLFPDGLRVSLPTDQIVFADTRDGAVRVGIGGMRFAGYDERGQLMFHRFREMRPEEHLSPARSHTMLLHPRWISSIVSDGQQLVVRTGGHAGAVRP
jgi:hypothetical protein